jgi:predicted phosphodiesterase
VPSGASEESAVRPKTPVSAVAALVLLYLLLASAPSLTCYCSTGASVLPRGPRLPDQPEAKSPPTPDLWPDRPAVDRPAEEILFVFAAIADSHIKRYQFDDYRYLKALSISRELLANCVADINDHVPPVDFVVHLGDVTDFGTVSDFNHAKNVLDKLQCPLYPVVGNHDNFMSDNKAAWKEFAALDSTNYTFDYRGFHFVVIDCTPNPYDPAEIGCDSVLRDWVVSDLARNSGRPAVILSHFNMWERDWNAMFDTTEHYAEYDGMPELRQVLEEAGNVVAVINGHVHANRVEVHNGIYYIDIGATLVGRPSIRYFYVYPTRIAVMGEYISDRQLLQYVEDLGPMCCCCFDRFEVCDYIDGALSDREFTIPTRTLLGAGPHPVDPSFPMALRLECEGDRSIKAAISSGITGNLKISLYDVRGRHLGQCSITKRAPVCVADLSRELASIKDLPGGVYFVHIRQGVYSRSAKLVLAD